MSRGAHGRYRVPSPAGPPTLSPRPLFSILAGLSPSANTSTLYQARYAVSSHLNTPHGGKLVDLLVADSRAKEIKAQSRDWPSWDLTPRQLCDLEMLCNGS